MADRAAVPPNPDSLIPTQRARRERIVDQASDFLVDHEYEAIQVRDIADRAGVALGTVYRYFASKEHLFAAVLVKWGASFRSRVGHSPRADSDVADQLRAVYLRSIDAFERRPEFFRMMVVIERTTDPYARELVKEFTGVTSAVYREPLGTLDADQATVITNTLLAVLNGVLRAWAAGDLPIADVRRRMSDAIDLIFGPPPRARSDAPIHG